MAKNRRKYRRGRRKKGNWFTRLKTHQKVLVGLATVFLLFLLIGFGYVMSKWSKIDKQEIKTEDLIINTEVQENRNIDLGEGYTNIALFGVDSRDGSLGEGNRTDCMIVASLNNETKEIKMVSIYRDSLLDLSEGTYQKCNAAYSYGGPKLAINMLNMNLDLDIQDYVTVDFGAITDIVDAVGGLDLEITEEEVGCINEYLWETAASAGKEYTELTSPGLQHLDGVQTTTYARIRKTAGGDFARTERQRIVIEKLVEKLKKVNLRKLDKMIDEVFPQISTSFTLKELMYYALAYKEYVLLENTGFPYDYTFDSIPEVGSVVVPDSLTSNVAKLHQFLFGESNYMPSDTVNMVSANILNRTNGGYSAQNDTQEVYVEESIEEHIENNQTESSNEMQNPDSGESLDVESELNVPSGEGTEILQ